MKIWNFNRTAWKVYFRHIFVMQSKCRLLWIAGDGKNFVSNCSISKVLHIQILPHLGPRGKKPIETEGESHSTGTSRQVQVLRKHGKCIYRGNDVRRSCPFSLLLLSSKCRLAISSGRSSFTDSGGYLNVGGCFRCCPSSQLRFLRTIALLAVKYRELSLVLCVVEAGTEGIERK